MEKSFCEKIIRGELRGDKSLNGGTKRLIVEYMEALCHAVLSDIVFKSEEASKEEIISIINKKRDEFNGGASCL